MRRAVLVAFAVIVVVALAVPFLTPGNVYEDCAWDRTAWTAALAQPPGDARYRAAAPLADRLVKCGDRLAVGRSRDGLASLLGPPSGRGERRWTYDLGDGTLAVAFTRGGRVSGLVVSR